MTGWRPSRRAMLAGIAALPAARAVPPRAAADRYLDVAPRTITAFPAPRSPGGPHDYYSEADYWWPDPIRPGEAYVRRDGRSNPDRFDRHRDAMIELSLAVPALVVAWRETRDPRYARHAARFLDAWFVDRATAMTPDLRFAQRIIGVDTGRAIGIIDTVHLVEVARAAQLLERGGALPHAVAVRAWFARYLDWLTTSARGQEERDQRNNHGTCWALQAAAFARLTGDTATVGFCADRFRTRLIPDQVAPDGAQPLELARTKPFAYSLFNLDALAAVAHVASTPDDDLWRFRTADHRSLPGAIGFMAPFIRDSRRWPYARDIEYFDRWPVRSVALLFAGRALDDPRYLALWRRLPPIPPVREVIRNVPLRQPALWL